MMETNEVELSFLLLRLREEDGFCSSNVQHHRAGAQNLPTHKNSSCMQRPVFQALLVFFLVELSSSLRLSDPERTQVEWAEQVRVILYIIIVR